ncbi:cytochrome c [Sphingobium sufflavum]|uniref:c-type cytochrome n=1 Tax=Sphingobium sufflavum TaxID=1129547 RepID=UPI001F46CF28|nr:cytochrome c [Sphingobium sufflavum]MCE7796233.1 cytochrome c [Sphingobium sufflavum]
MTGATRRFAIPALALAALAAPVAAAPGDVVKTRIAGFRELGAAFKNVNDELKGSAPQTYVMQLSARQIRDFARQQYSWFPQGSGPQAGVKTAAKPDIWAKGAEFKAAQDNFAKQADAFAKVAGTGDTANIRAQAKLLGQSCGACHRAFRTESRD